MTRGRMAIGIAASLIFLWLAYSALKILNYGRPLFAPSPQQLTNIGDPIAKALNQHHAEHGRYPETLDQAGIENISTPYGEYRYEVSADGSDCSLTIGDYHQYLFEVQWWSGTGWNIDT